MLHPAAPPAAAIRGFADAIITFNLQDFPAAELAKYDIEALHPDEFVMHQLSLSQDLVLRAAKRHRASLRNPAKSTEEYLATMQRQGLPRTVAVLREYGELI